MSGRADRRPESSRPSTNPCRRDRRRYVRMKPIMLNFPPPPLNLVMAYKGVLAVSLSFSNIATGSEQALRICTWS